MLKLLWRGMGLELCPTKYASQKMVNYMLSIQLIATLSGLLRPCPNVSASLLLSLAIAANWKSCMLLIPFTLSCVRYVFVLVTISNMDTQFAAMHN